MMVKAAMNRRGSAASRSVRQFLQATTLHGFKYLSSKFIIDRLGWALVCAAGACCAGALCLVLWARFRELPALLQLRGAGAALPPAAFLPRLALCPPLHALAHALQLITMNETMTRQVTRMIENVLAGKSSDEDQLGILEDLLSAQNSTLIEMMLKYSPPCEELITGCRWQKTEAPCKLLFEKELTMGGVCCVMNADKAYERLLNTSAQPAARYDQIRTLDLSLQCSDEIINDCKLFVNYDGETNLKPIMLAPGYIYFAQILFNSVSLNTVENFLEPNCNNEKGYSKQICQNKCGEKYCGCSDPLRVAEVGEDVRVPRPPCSVAQLRCIRAYIDQDNGTCGCLTSCNQITSDVNMESTTLNLDIYTIDPIYNGLNSKSTVIHLRLNFSLSKLFTLKPTETWFTLLSSLGGVFNMFLGVGLFSALEILFLVVNKFLNAILKPQIN